MLKKIGGFLVAIIFLLSPLISSKPVYADTNGNVAFGSTITGNLPDDSTAVYTINLPKDGRITLNLLSEVSDIEAVIKDSKGNSVDRDYVFGSQSDPGRWNTSDDLEAGTYYLKLKDMSGNGNFNFKVDYTEVDDNNVEPNNGTETAQPLYLNANPSTGFLKWDDKVDYYKVELPKSGRLSLYFSSYIQSSQIQVIDQNGEELRSDYVYDGATDNPKKLNAEVDLAKGAYYIKVSSGVYNYTGKYTLKADFNEVYSDNIEPNDGTETAQNLDLNTAPLNGYITANSKVDYYKFVMPVKGTIDLQVNFCFKEGSVSIVNENGDSATDDRYQYVGDGSDENPYKYRSSSELDAGTYYLKISPETYSDYTGKYTVKINCKEASTQTENAVKSTVDTALSKKNFASFQIAYGTIMHYYSDNLAMRDKYLSQIGSLYNVVNTPDVSAVRNEMMKLSENRDLGAYNKIVYELANNIKDEENKQYVLGEIARWGKDYVWTPAVSHAVDAVNEAWKEKTPASKQAAADAIAKVESQASKDYLTGQLSSIK